ncbi:LVIS_2131 family protein [Loigolactobacillus zhaoyuanensis]|uniref:LVIS_2131 family protein n=1 Tax=Loigolactobacillus zhaoyuanensis TaxID=2486017 RepID=A0ABW8U9T3_9LACO|nr:LVIS_2131 family protein [Loigolactobacillus zhaoyuanensis]
MALVNIFGIVLWLVVLGVIWFTLHNIRSRRLRRLVKKQHQFSGKDFTISTVLVLIAVLLLGIASYLTFFRDVDLEDNSAVALKYDYEPLVMTPIGGKFYDVKVENGNGKQPLQHYTYWVKGARYQITSSNATVVAGPKPLNVTATNYPWSRKELAQQDKKYEQTYAATMHATYKSTVINGLGLRAGRTAMRFTLIRVPNSSVIYLKPAK